MRYSGESCQVIARGQENGCDPHKRKVKKGGYRSDCTGDEIHVAGDDALVVAGVVLLARLGGEAGAVAAVVDEEEVAGLGGSEEIGEGATDVLAGGLEGVVVGVDEDGDVVLGEAVAVDEAAVHPVDVVDAALELGLGARVVAPDQQRLPRHFRARFLCGFPPTFRFSRARSNELERGRSGTGTGTAARNGLGETVSLHPQRLIVVAKEYDRYVVSVVSACGRCGERCRPSLKEDREAEKIK